MTAATDIRDSREGKDMLITRECDYAVRVIRALSGAERLTVGEICEREEITAPFAYKILKKLQKAKLVRGYRGVHGGYSMNRTPGEITLFDIYTAIDPETYDHRTYGSPVSLEASGDNRDKTPCLVHRELVEIQKYP